MWISLFGKIALKLPKRVFLAAFLPVLKLNRNHRPWWRRRIVPMEPPLFEALMLGSTFFCSICFCINYLSHFARCRK